MKASLILLVSAVVCLMARADGTNLIQGTTGNTNQITSHIEGAFGLKLGNIVDRATLGAKLDGTFTWAVTPPLTNAEFSAYAVSLVPKTDRIFEIIAMRQIQIRYADDEFLGICEIIRRKYTPNQEPPAKYDKTFVVGSLELNPPGIRKIEVSRPDEITITVIYRDLGLQVEAKREEAEISAAHKDGSGL